MIHPKAQDVIETVSQNHTTRISCQREIEVLREMVKVKQIKRLQKLYLYLKNN